MKKIFILAVVANALLLSPARAQTPTDQIQTDLTQLKADENVFQNAVSAVDPQSAQDQAALQYDLAAVKTCAKSRSSCAAAVAKAKADETALKADWPGAKAACATVASCAAAQATLEADRAQLQSNIMGSLVALAEAGQP